MNTLRNLALSLAASVMAFFIVAVPTDDRPFCAGGGPSGQLGSNCHFGPAPADWYLGALPPAIAVFLVVLVVLWAVQRIRRQRE
jgi:hypothetical protein